MTQTIEITVVTKPLTERGTDTCAQCAAVKRKLKKLGAEYTTILTDSEEGMALIEETKLNYNISTAPLVIVNNGGSVERFGGYNTGAIDRLITPFI